MIIQKITPSNINDKTITKNKALISSVNHPQTETESTRKNSSVHFPYYRVSFGNNSGSDKKIEPAKTFDESVRKYFRLKPDSYQTDAAKHIYDNDDTLVLAPTGTGKTLIAEYAINKNLANGKTTFYTTPLKALSNEKYTDFCKLYGKENVGLLTGEIKINSQAPILIMTTEIYRNMLIGDEKDRTADRLKNVASVIYDEFHYMNEPERGEVWETSIMYTPPEVQQLLLSATAENGKVVKKWINRLLDEKSSGRKAEIVDVPSDERHVPLKYYIYSPKRGEKIHPLTEESYNLERLGKAFVADSKRTLTGKQTEVLSDISFKINTQNHQSAEVSAQAGYNYLKRNLDAVGSIGKIEQLLVQNLGYSQPEAERAASILADKASCKLNKSLKQPTEFNDNEKKFLSKKEKEDYYRKNKPEKLISPDKAKRLALAMQFNHDEMRALKQLSWSVTGKNTAEDGVTQLLSFLNNKEMGIKEFEQKLRSTKLKDKSIETLSKMLTITKYPQKEFEEFSLINVLNKENKLPAIFFRFSKRQCDELRRSYVKSGESLLNDEEKQKAAEIIKKHIEKGSFLGTDENGTDLLSGVAVHHAGKMPGYKALVEELAQNKLLKVVFATSTLGAGINVPAKTVVFTQLSKYSGNTEEASEQKFIRLTPNEFHQMGGRAGRRGKDFVGNVVVMPDKDYGVQSVYELATAKPDAIESSFKPTYSFIAHLIAQDGTLKNLETAVDRSFLQERLESLGEKPYKIKNKIKKEFISMANVLTDEETECFFEKDGRLYSTIKGELVSKARGVDGLLFADFLYKAGLEHLSPAEMAAVACALTHVDERTIHDSVKLPEMVADTVDCVDMLKETLEDIEAAHKSLKSPIILNRPAAQYVWQWADALDTNQKLPISEQQETRHIWSEVVKSNKKENPAFSEGDFLKSMNNTVDILEQIKEVSRYAYEEHLAENETKEAEKMKAINDVAKKALRLVKQDPVLYKL